LLEDFGSTRLHLIPIWLQVVGSKVSHMATSSEVRGHILINHYYLYCHLWQCFSHIVTWKIKQRNYTYMYKSLKMLHILNF